MNLERAFLDDVIERPDDDAPRLVYADWLEDKGDPERAEFIRAQCRLEKLADNDPARPDLLKREAELLDANAVRWAEPLRGMVSEWGFRRGFIDFVRLDHSHGIEIGALPRLFQLAPLEALALEEFGEVTAPALLALKEQLPRLHYLDLFGIGDTLAGDLVRLIASPSLWNLRGLFLDQEAPSAFPVEALAILGRSPALSRLTDLGLAVGVDLGHLPAGVVRGIARSPYLRPRRLYLGNTWLASPLRATDLRHPAIQGLEVLSLQNSAIANGLWEALVRPGSFPNLQLLRLCDVGLDAPTRKALVERHGEDKVDFGPLDGEELFPRRHGFTWPSP